MHDIVHDFLQIARHNRDGSYITQYQRKTMLMQFGNQLVELGWKTMRARDFKGRHVHALLKLWQGQGVSDATIKNRLAILRWLCEKLDRVSVMPKTNAPYHLAPRPQAATVSKGWAMTADVLGQVDDPAIRMSFELQAAYGLRRKECLMIRVWQADQEDHLALKGSWTKGRRPREVAIRWPDQREVLDRAKALVRFQSASLIPRDLAYHQQRNKYDYWARKLGLAPLHGLRHLFAQRLYAELSGMPCPVQQGPHVSEMTPAQRVVDRAARQQVSAALGHGRIAITRLYLG